MPKCINCFYKEQEAAAANATARRLQETVDKLVETVNGFLASKPTAQQAAKAVVRWMEAGESSS